MEKNCNLSFFNLSAERIKFFNTKKITIIYARFFLHAVNDKIENKFFYNINKYFSKKIKIALEFRTTKDALIKKGRKVSKYERITTHYRRFIDLNSLLKKIRKYKLKVIYKKMGTNLSKTSTENPHLCRLILKFND